MKVRDIINNNSKWIENKKNKNYSPKVSVFLPTFSRAKDGYLERAILSVLNQTFRNIELIIIDDASTDGSEEIVKHFMKQDSRVHCIRHQSNIGFPAISEYEAYIKSKGRYIAFIFDDNEWERDFLQKTIEYMEINNSKATFGRTRLYYGENNKYVEIGSEFNKNEIVVTNFIGNGSVVLDREVIEKVGLYDPHIALKRLCDWDLWRRIIENYSFDFTNILATSEYGVLLSDSLGNSEKLNSWVSYEQMSKKRNDKLKFHFY